MKENFLKKNFFYIFQISKTFVVWFKNIFSKYYERGRKFENWNKLKPKKEGFWEGPSHPIRNYVSHPYRMVLNPRGNPILWTPDSSQHHDSSCRVSQPVTSHCSTTFISYLHNIHSSFMFMLLIALIQLWCMLCAHGIPLWCSGTYCRAIQSASNI